MVDHSAHYPRPIWLSTLALSLALVACGSGTTNATTDAGVSDTSAVDTGAAETGKPPAPTDLPSFESNGEGIGVALQVGDYVKAKAILDQAVGTWATLKGVLVSGGAKADAIARIDDTLAKLKTEIAAKMTKEAEYHANQLSLTIPDFFDLYTFNVPSEALRLDAWFREMQIDGEYSDFAKAATSLTATRASWAKFKPVCAARAAMRSDIVGAATVVADMDKTMTDADAAIAAKSSKQVVDVAQLGLDLVDVGESVFK